MLTSEVSGFTCQQGRIGILALKLLLSCMIMPAGLAFTSASVAVKSVEFSIDSREIVVGIVKT
jgi:hypothetical protein